MADLTAASFTVKVLRRWVAQRKRYVVGRLSLKDTADVYPDNGIPLPHYSVFGFYRKIDSMIFFGETSSEQAPPPAQVVALDAVAGNVTSGTHSWKTTSLLADGSESLPSPATNVLTTVEADHGKVTLAKPTNATGRVTHWNVYRTVAGDTGAYKLVNPTPIAIGTATYQDNIADGSLGADAPTADKTQNAYHLRWDKTNHKLFLYEEEASAAGGPLLEADTSEIPGPRTWDFFASGW